MEDFARKLHTDPWAALRPGAADAIATHDTGFFRNRSMFDALRSTVLPRLISANSGERRLRLWSAASSTGQEAYSLAMLLHEDFPELADWDVKIVATDCSQRVIEYAERGRYSRLEVNRGLPARLLVKYLMRDGEEWEVAAKLRSICAFRYADLAQPLPRLPVFDLVLLRNVLLYFPRASRSLIFRRVHGQTARSGFLVLGASEQAEDATNLFHPELAADYCFYRPAAQS